ncbi:SAGA-associated factor 29A [Sesamum angolense]|uniref:SAGA-associated factor 29A n=1 Tax=Sesamum angolense TaxID=2727404 RepID=A0AAE2BPG2_9LAMI|nr:SAGA-associated factor 29A [Sesamum angolense]
MSSPDIAGILDNSKELDRLRKEQEEVLTEINKMHKKLQSKGSEHKKKRMKADSEIPRQSPSMRSHLESLANLKGEQVAARVTQEDAGKDEWFVVKVIHFDKETREFEVLDEEPGDDEESTGQSVPDFPPGRHVLAVYPETTALYKATVVQARKRKIDDYILEFDDDEEDGSLPQRSVPFHRVVPLPEGYRQ